MRQQWQQLVACARGGDHVDRDERGASLVEYALLVALIAVVAIGAVTYLGETGSDKVDEAATALDGEDDEVEVADGCTADHPYALNATRCMDLSNEEYDAAIAAGEAPPPHTVTVRYAE